MIRHALLPALKFKLTNGGATAHRWIVVYQGQDKYWVAECKSLPGCISQGRTKKDAVAQMEAAIAAYLEILTADNLPIPAKVKHKTLPAAAAPLKISARTCISVLAKKDFYLRKTTESGIIILRRDKPFTQLVVPECRRLDMETLLLIIKASGMTFRQFMKLVYEGKD